VHALTLLSLAQTSSARSGQASAIIVPLVILIAVVVLGGLIVMAVRRWTVKSADALPDGFTLQGLREMRDRGEISEDEFIKAKQTMITRVQAALVPDEDECGDTDNPPSVASQDREPS
jgi:hypothetical protein